MGTRSDFWNRKMRTHFARVDTNHDTVVVQHLAALLVSPTLRVHLRKALSHRAADLAHRELGPAGALRDEPSDVVERPAPVDG